MHNCCLPKEGWVIWEVQTLPQQKQGQGQGISSRSYLHILGPLEATRQTWKWGLESWQPLLCKVGSGGERETLPPSWVSSGRASQQKFWGKMDQIGFEVTSSAGLGRGRCSCFPKDWGESMQGYFPEGGRVHDSKGLPASV